MTYAAFFTQPINQSFNYIVTYYWNLLADHIRHLLDIILHHLMFLWLICPQENFSKRTFLTDIWGYFPANLFLKNSTYCTQTLSNSLLLYLLNVTFLAVSAALFLVAVRLSHGSNTSVLSERCKMSGAVHVSLCLRCEEIKLQKIIRRQQFNYDLRSFCNTQYYFYVSEVEVIVWCPLFFMFLLFMLLICL